MKKINSLGSFVEYKDEKQSDVEPNFGCPNICIEETENGYEVIVIDSIEDIIHHHHYQYDILKGHNRKKYTFENYKNLQKWLKKNISPVKDITDFVNTIEKQNYVNFSCDSAQCAGSQ